MTKRYSLAQVRAKYAETHPDQPEWITFTLDDSENAEEFRFHHPVWQTDAEKAAFGKAVQAGDDLKAAEAILGAAEWKRFKKAGGEARDIIMLISTIGDEMTGVDESGNPTTR